MGTHGRPTRHGRREHCYWKVMSNHQPSAAILTNSICRRNLIYQDKLAAASAIYEGGFFSIDTIYIQAFAGPTSVRLSWSLVQPVSPVSSNSFLTSSMVKSLTRASTLTGAAVQAAILSRDTTQGLLDVQW